MPEVVATASGKVRGVVRDGVGVWRGVPYARVEGRWRPPAAVEAWAGERDATAWGPVAVQSRDPRVAMLSGVGEKMAMAEDCLSLNVFAPEHAERAPVLVWIHGGAFVMGSGSTPLYDGRTFARAHGLVVVTLNYRLGALGWLGGNWGLLDQVAALAWVKRNIAAFGGDPARVTIVGESAGASSAAALLAMPSARGLFRAAAIQSCALGATMPGRDEGEARMADARAAGLREDSSIDELIAIQNQLIARHGLAAFRPFVDGDALPRSPVDAVREGDAAPVPLLIGSNRDEWALFSTFLGGRELDAVVTASRGRFGDTVVDALLAAYDGNLTELVGDVAFRVPTIRIAEAHRAPAFVYRFDWRSPAMNGALGAAHGMELPFMWNRLDLPASQLLIGGDTAGAQPLATAMHAAWAAFVRDLDPNTTADGEHAGAGAAPTTPAALPRWPVYDAARRVMMLDRESSVADDPDAAHRAAWDALR